MSNQKLKSELEKVEKVLALLDSETADEIIGEESEEYETLIQGTRAVSLMTWLVMKQHGLRETGKSLRSHANGMAMNLTLVHYAFALGLQQGRQEQEDG